MATGKVDLIDFSAAVNAAKAQAKLHKPFVDLADALERIGSLDNAKKENEQALEVLTAEKTKLASEVKSLKSKLDKGLAEIADEVNAAKEAAAADLLKAKDEVAHLIEAAKSKAASKIAEADIKAEAIITNANSQLLALSEKADEAREATKQALAEQALAKSELDNINRKIDEAKAKVAGLLG